MPTLVCTNCNRELPIVHFRPKGKPMAKNLVVMPTEHCRECRYRATTRAAAKRYYHNVTKVRRKKNAFERNETPVASV